MIIPNVIHLLSGEGVTIVPLKTNESPQNGAMIALAMKVRQKLENGMIVFQTTIKKTNA